MAQAASVGAGGVTDVHAARLFNGSCLALTSGSVMFAMTADIVGALKQEFILDNAQIGLVMSGGSWGFTAAMFILGPLCDALGMRRLLYFACFSQAAGILLMILAGTGLLALVGGGSSAFACGMLFTGTLINGLGSGAVEAVCNPLIATIYPNKKTHKLSQFHMWFPGGIVIGGLLAYLFANINLNYWQLKLAVPLVPTAAYGIMFIREHFPVTERVQAGVSFGGMFKETLLRPLFLVLLVCMLMTASLELGPGRWIPAVLQAGGIPGILVLVWITGFMAVLRLFCGPVVKVLTNTGLLLLSSAVAGVGLLLLSFPANIYMVGLTATVFAFGVCYFWPAMLGTVAERVPKGGALALAIIGGTGGLFVGAVTAPVMGWIADKYLHQELVFRGTVDSKAFDRETDTVALLKDVQTAYTGWRATLGDTKKDEITKGEIDEVLKSTAQVLETQQTARALPEPDTANALRVAIKNGPPDGLPETAPAAAKDALAAKQKAGAVLNPADNKGGLMSFRWVSVVSIVLVVVFGIMFIQDRRRGGYRPDKITG